jgi:hypothetical protein
VSNFVAGATHDTVAFSNGAWSTGGTFIGLTNVDTSVNVGAGTGAAAVFTNAVGVGGTVVANAGLTQDVILLSSPELNASGLANSIATGGLTIPTALVAGTDYHFLVAYQVTGTTNVRIADLDVFATAASATINAANDHIVASDMVQLTGVSLGSLAGANIHFIA